MEVNEKRELGRILKDAQVLINGTRQDQYGNPEDNFKTIADLWTAYTGRLFSAHDVAVMMALMKCARIRTGSGTEDSIYGCLRVSGACRGYAARG